MSLRGQLLVVSVFLLALPWTGCQFVREMETALRAGQAQALASKAQALANVIAIDESLLYPSPARRSSPSDERPSIYARPSPEPIIVDGYGDGWEGIPALQLSSAAVSTPFEVSVRARTRDDVLYLLFNVADSELTYHNPGLSREPNGDRLVLRMWRDGRRQDYVVATAAPGKVTAQPMQRRSTDPDHSLIRGSWQDSQDGYTVELEMPMGVTGGRLGFYLIEASDRTRGIVTLGNITALETAAPPWLIYEPQRLADTAAPFSAAADDVLIIDRHQRVLTELPGDRFGQSGGEPTYWLLRLLYRSILSQGDLQPPLYPDAQGYLEAPEVLSALRDQPDVARYRDPGQSTRTVLSAAAPIRDNSGVMGAVVLRQSSETYLSLTDQAFSRLLGYSLLALCIAVLALLGYASLLSWRIQRLSRAAAHAIGEDGRLTGAFPRSAASDEIGDLSRQYADLLDRVRNYNDYLKSLSRKLAHELRTPIAVIQSSLDNLEKAPKILQADSVYLHRAREGLNRLQRILTDMSEANQLEESIINQSLEPTQLVPLFADVFNAYQTVFDQHDLQLDIKPVKALVMANPDLLVQALDKLAENAVSFTPQAGTIEFSLRGDGKHWSLSVSNEGPTLDPSLENRLFEPLVSEREPGGEGVHLGLGLHIVRLIVDFHDGKVRASNRSDGNGVVVTIELPAS
ncbi:MAG: ATP-binding protein [Pseudomonadota bacterium]